MLRPVLLGLALHASVVHSLPPEAVRPSQECRMVGVDCDRDPAAKRALQSTTMLLNVGNEEDPCTQPVPPMLPAADPSYSSDEHDHLLVISRYDERLDWIAELLEERSWIKNVLIINKGEPILAPLPEDKVIIRNARNVGREGETLLHYIIQDYDRLPETLWFMQADPFTHQPQAKRLFDPEVVALYNRTFQPLTMQFAEYARIPESLLAAEETQLNGMVRQVYLQAATGGIKFATGLDEDDPIARSYGVLGFTNILDQMQEEHKVELRQQTVRKVCNYLGITEIERATRSSLTQCPRCLPSRARPSRDTRRSSTRTCDDGSFTKMRPAKSRCRRRPLATAWTRATTCGKAGSAATCWSGCGSSCSPGTRGGRWHNGSRRCLA